MSAFELPSSTPGANGLELISDVTLGANGSFDIQSIPGTYKHLLLILSLRGARVAVAVGVDLRFNNDSGTTYNFNLIQLTSTTVSGVNVAADTSAECSICPAASAPANFFGGGTVTILDYTASKFKAFMGDAGGFGAETIGTNWFQRRYHGLWESTAAITRIQIFDGDGASNLLAGSRATLYGMN